MSRARIVPIIDIAEKMAEFKRVFDTEIYDLLYASSGYQPEEDFTFRMSLDLTNEHDREERNYVMARLQSRGTPGAEQLIELLEENTWDVSFFADFF